MSVAADVAARGPTWTIAWLDLRVLSEYSPGVRASRISVAVARRGPWRWAARGVARDTRAPGADAGRPAQGARPRPPPGASGQRPHPSRDRPPPGTDFSWLLAAWPALFSAPGRWLRCRHGRPPAGRLRSGHLPGRRSCGAPRRRRP